MQLLGFGDFAFTFAGEADGLRLPGVPAYTN